MGGSLLGVFCFLAFAFSVVMYIGDRGVCFIFLSFVGVMGTVTGCVFSIPGWQQSFPRPL